MSFTQGLKERPKTYIGILSIISLVIGVNEFNAFWTFIQETTITINLILGLVFVILINIAIRWEIWKHK